MKNAANEKADQVKEAGAQLADDASKKAEETTNTIVGSAIHAKDVAVEKAQELGSAVNTNIYLYIFLKFSSLFLGCGKSTRHSVSRCWCC